MDWKLVMGNLFAQYEIYCRLLLSAIIGFMIGWDRSSKNKPAGLKTYTYVCVASTLITIVSIYSIDMYKTDLFTRVDPMRLAAQIVSGLGFLGAGLILKTDVEIKGLTSAAMIFFTGGVGIAIGAGFYGFVIFSVAIAFLFAKLGSLLEDSALIKERMDEEE